MFRRVEEEGGGGVIRQELQKIRRLMVVRVVDKVGCLSVLNDHMKIASSILLLLAQQLSNLNI